MNMISSATAESIDENENNQTNSLPGIDNYTNNYHTTGSSNRQRKIRAVEDEWRSKTRFPSGISALIQAATFQLEQLAEIACSRENASHNVRHNAQSDADELESELTSASSISSNNHVTEIIDKNPKFHQKDGTARGIGKKSENETTPPLVPYTGAHHSKRFPDVLMTLALDPRNSDVITFLPDNRFFAIRARTFSDDLMTHVFDPPIQSFEDFLRVASEWGFSTILDPSCTEISVLRHPYFMKGNWEKCACIKYGESPTSVRLHALPERSQIQYSLSDESVTKAQGNGSFSSPQANDGNASTNSKRRLSTGFLSRRNSVSSVSSQKQRKESIDPKFDEVVMNAMIVAQSHTQESGDESEIGNPEDATVNLGTGSYSNHQTQADDVRSFALAITTEELHLQCAGSRRNSLCGSRMSNFVQETDGEAPLIDRAVTSATHTIVTDAIETLLRDESHTKETYLKHEKELSKSLLPGVVPISTMLFAPSATRKMSGNVPVTFETKLDIGQHEKSDTESKTTRHSSESAIAVSDVPDKNLVHIIPSSSGESEGMEIQVAVTTQKSDDELPTTGRDMEQSPS